MDNQNIKDMITSSLNKEVQDIKKLGKGQSSSTELYLISTSDRELVFKKITDNERFKRSAFAYENITEKEMPELVKLDKENKFLIIPFYENHQMDWSNKEMYRNLISTTIRSHKKIHKMGVNPPLQVEYDELVDSERESLLKDTYNEKARKYKDYVKDITKELKNTTNGIRVEYNYNDSHIGNFIISENGEVKKLLDWEHSGLTPIIEEISKTRYGLVDLPNKFVDIDLEEIYKEERVYVPRERTINMWVLLRAISSYNTTLKKGPLCEEYIELAGSEDNLLEAQEEIIKQLLDKLDFTG